MGSRIAAVTQALLAWLAERHDRGDTLDVLRTWQIEENGWSACRHGVEGEMFELDTSGPQRRPTRELLRELIERLRPIATWLGAGNSITHARNMVEVNGSIAQRRIAAGSDTHAVARWLTERFLQQPDWMSPGRIET